MGNRGQADYAMANEVLNKTALNEAARRQDCRVVAINWGPWDGGMVTSALKREFERNGIGLIPVDRGVQCMLDEMKAGSNNFVEVVIGAEITSPGTARGSVTLQKAIQRLQPSMVAASSSETEIVS